MLHHAEVEGIDLKNIRVDSNGYGHLTIKINKKQYTITWTPEHLASI